MHELNTRLQRTPFELLPVRTFLKRAGQLKRGADGRERRSEMSVWELLQVECAIVIAVALVEDEGCVVGHGIVWDAWRRILFIGPGAFDDRGLDGALVVEPADIADMSRVDPAALP